jgi:NADP-dependent 3-hydroxy acid dehydrogenase YdfG
MLRKEADNTDENIIEVHDAKTSLRCLLRRSKPLIGEFYQAAISADAVARAIAYAIEQPADVDVNEIVLRPTVQDF